MALPFPMPQTVVALQDALAFVRDTWVAAAEAALRPPHQATYVAGLLTPESLVYPDGGDALAGRVVNVAPGAARIEEGSPAIHLPSAIRWALSRAARRSKAGRYYLIIPFTHRAPRAPAPSPRPLGMLSWGQYRVARQLQRGQYLTAGSSAGRAVHAPGLSPYMPRNPRNVRPGYMHAALQERLIRTSERRRGYSTFMTFRTMTQDSQGWWLPARPGAHLVPQVTRAARPQVQAMLETAVRADVEAHLRQQLGG